MHDGKRQDADVRRTERRKEATWVTGEGESASDLRERWTAARRDIEDSARILEQLFKKFEIDPGLASDLKSAAQELAEEELLSGGSTRAKQRERPPGRPVRRPRDLN